MKDGGQSTHEQGVWVKIPLLPNKVGKMSGHDNYYYYSPCTRIIHPQKTLKFILYLFIYKYIKMNAFCQ